MNWKSIILYLPATAVVIGLLLVVFSTAFPPVHARIDNADQQQEITEFNSTVSQVNQWFRNDWQVTGLAKAPPADEKILLRRLSLALHGTIPSLEELRRFEADQRPDRLQQWCREMLEDPRFADYFAERFTRAFVGTQGEPFLVFRRDRFRNWLVEQLKQNRPYNQVVQEIISQDGLWTGEPATNFMTHAVLNGDVDENKLAGKTVRAVLGQRIDCAQCHDHPFADWKQHDFEGLAAYFGQVRLSAFGVEDRKNQEYKVEDRITLEERTVQPEVPFQENLLPDSGTRREQLAFWSTHPANRRFSRAAVNRIWALMFGKAFSEGAPYYTRVDDLPDPEDDEGTGTALDLLADAFVASNYNIKQLIETIAALEVYRLDSTTDEIDDSIVRQQIDHWAVFPLIRLRPEQVVGSMLQAASIKTIDQNSHLLTRTFKLINENDFLKEYGDFGADELDERAGTVPQALLRMNGKLFEESTRPSPFNATPRIALASGSPEHILETCFLTCLTRPPSQKEKQFFLNKWQEEKSSRWPQRTHDLYWALINSPEFSWNH
ncbi:DUF1549 domain-containing protein [uncultured Rubinisphaera sp.]|uniref:DUF1549 domain-containing protein n=1 Tax=uncultured Rubinisphaera sp. TaxID=1678686 RepID=UPI0030DA4C1D